MKNCYPSFLHYLFLAAGIFLLKPASLQACDGSGYVINDLTDNGNGTWTLNITVHVAGFDWSGGILGGTRGFYFSTDAPNILSVSPNSLTSLNGTALNAVISGNSVQWGNPASGPYFVQSSEPTQTFNVTLVLDQEPTQWMGGGMEENGCPGGAGTSNPSPGYSGVFNNYTPPPLCDSAPGLPINDNSTTSDQVTLSNAFGPLGSGTSIEAVCLLIQHTWIGDLTITLTSPSGTSVTLAARVGGSADNFGNPSSGQLMCFTPNALISVGQYPGNSGGAYAPAGAFSNFNGQDPNGNWTLTVSDNASGDTGTLIAWGIAFSSGGCGCVPPDISIPPPPPACAGETVSLDAIANNANSISWSNGASGSSITLAPSATQNLTATAQNACGQATASVTIDVMPQPTVTAPPSVQACQGDPVTLTADAQNAGAIEWSNGQQGATITINPNQSQTLTVTATNSCGQATATVQVTVTPPPTINVLQGDASICEGESATLQIDAPGATDVQWSNGQQGSSITVAPGQTQSYSVTASNACGQEQQVFTIDVQPQPSLQAIQGDQTICQGESAVLEVFGQNVNDITWSNGATGSTIAVTPGQTQSFTATAGNGCGQVQQTITVTVLPPPSLTVLQGDASICEGESATLQVDAPGAADIQWSNGQQGNSITVAPGQAQSYSVTASNACGQEQQVFTVDVQPLPILEIIQGDQTICQGQSVALEVFGQNVNDITWSNGQQGSSITVAPGQTQSFTATAGNSCGQVQQTITVTVVQPPSLAIVQGSQSICAGQGTTLEVLAPGAASVTWSTGQAGNSITVAPGQTTAYTVTAANSCGSAEETIIVDVIPQPSLTVIQDGRSICQGQSVTLEVFAENEDFLFWDNGMTGSSITVSPGQTTVFTATAGNACGQVEEPIVVDVLPLPTLAVIQGNQSICDGAAANLEVSAQNATSIDWSTGQSGSGIVVAPGATQTYTATAANACGQQSVDITVEVLFPPTLDIVQGDQPICEGETATLEVSASGSAPVTWQHGAAGELIAVNPTQTQAFTATAANSCGQASQTIIVDVSPQPSIMLVQGDQAVCQGESATLIVEASNQDGIQWSNGNSGESITVIPAQTTAYTATAVNSCGQAEVVAIVDVLPTLQSNLELQACQGTTVTYQGAELSPGESRSFTLAAQNGCDSIVEVTVAGLPVFRESLTLEACSGAQVSYNGDMLSAGQTQAFLFTAQNGCDSIVDVSVVEVPLIESSLELQACTGEIVQYAGTDLSPGQNRSFTFTAQNGCDSTVHVSVTELPHSTQQVQLETCPGSGVDYNGATLFPGESQAFTFPAQNGCDSIVQVNVIALPTYEENLELQACTGSSVSYNGVNLLPGDSRDFLLATQAGCDSLVHVTVAEVQALEQDLLLRTCPGTTLSYNGAELAPGDSQSFTFTTITGCDSTVNVSVAGLPVFEQNLTLTACAGTVVEYNGVSLMPGENRSFTFTAGNGCDSTVHVSVAELPVYEEQLEFAACTGTTIEYNGLALPAGSSRSFTFATQAGCDSVVHVMVAELMDFQQQLEFTACAGETVMYNDTELLPGETQSFAFTAQNGCDSLVEVTVLELPVYEENLEFTACSGATVSYGGATLLPGESRDFQFTTAGGCDSIIHVNVVELPAYEQELQLQACTGASVTYGGMELQPGEARTFSFTTLQGCDSIINVTVEEVLTIEENLEFQACSGSGVVYDGVELLAGESQPFTYTSQQGCDSIVLVSVLELPVYGQNLSLSACNGSTVEYNGVALAPGDSRVFTFISQQGCDSIVTATVEALPIYEEDLVLEACSGSTITYSGTTLAPGDSQTFTFNTQAGCDSIVHLSVVEVASFDIDLELSACAGSAVEYNGQSLFPGDSHSFAFTTEGGCDSIVTVAVLELPVYEQELQLQACEGTTATFNGATLAPGEERDFLFTTAAGCDSLIRVSVLGVENIQTSESRAICAGDSSLIFGQYQSQPGSYNAVYTSANGCDSTHTVTLSTSPLPQPEASVQASCPDRDNGAIEIQTSSGAAPYNYAWNDGAFTASRSELPPGNYTVAATDALGCRQVLAVTVPERSVEVEIETRDITCFGRKDGLISLKGEGEGLSYQLNGGPLQSFGFFSPLEAGQYTARAEDSYGCRYELGALLIEEPEQLQVVLPPDTTIQLGKSVRIPALVNRPDSLSFSWNPVGTLDCGDCQVPTASPEHSTRYRVAVRDGNGCPAEDDILILVNRRRNVYIPSAFSPNGDGANERFYIFGDESIKEVRSFQIFSRWGEAVFEGAHFPPNDPTYGWDGNFHGQPMNAAVFVYFAEIEFTDGEVALFKGDVTLAR